MAGKKGSSIKSKPVAKGTVSKVIPAKAIVSTTPVRNTPIPKGATPVRKEVTHEMISLRAYSIFIAGQGGSEVDHWLRAERELKGV